ncbi:MAG: ABC transporter permease [Candidatus Riflebacteria bacterium]|nr:ABC transporter permease [Candidatus Riflebacteria bacterium]
MILPLGYSLQSVLVRKSASLMAIGGIALVVLVLIFLQAMGEGLRRTVATSGTPQNMIVLRKGSDAELGSQVGREDSRIVEALPYVARNEAGEPLFVNEGVLIIARDKKDGGQANLTVRGIMPLSPSVHHGVRLTAGRWLKPGSNEAVVGVALARRLDGLGIGQVMTINKQDWNIVGVFEADGSGLESEIWMDLELYQSVFRRSGVYSSTLFRVMGDPREVKKRIAQMIANDPRLRSIEVLAEDEYYQKQSKLMFDLIMVLTAILTTIMSVGAIVGAMNTMYAAVSHRQREIGCLLALGFTPEAVWISFIVESVALSLIGAVTGCLLSLPFHGMSTGTTNWATFAETAFRFQITPGILATAVVVAVIMGFCGGFFPAFRASRMKVVEALRRG